MELLEGNMEEDLHNLVQTKTSSTWRALNINNEFDFIIVKVFYWSKYTTKKEKGQATGWVKISTWDIKDLPFDTAVSWLVLCPREMSAYVYKKTCIKMLLAVLFLMAPKWKQAKCSQTTQWINRLWYIHRIG